LTRERELQSDYWTISRLDHPRLTRSLSKTSSCRVADGADEVADSSLGQGKQQTEQMK
jgi:hypothetical protein